MSKQQVKAFLFMEEQTEYSPTYRRFWGPTLWKCAVDENEDRIFVKEVVCEVDVPEDFDPTVRQIAALERQRELVRAEFSRAIAEINNKLSKLQAITYEPAVTE